MTAATVVHFAQAARLLRLQCQERGLIAPSFRSPSRAEGSTRSIKYAARCPVIAVTTRDRDIHDVYDDMIEGVIHVNTEALPTPEHRQAMREHLHHQLESLLT